MMIIKYLIRKHINSLDDEGEGEDKDNNRGGDKDEDRGDG